MTNYVVETPSFTLSDQERSRLDLLEAMVVESSHKLGAALFTIHNEKLYREYGTWESYCLQRFKFSRFTVDRHLSAYKEAQLLSNFTKHTDVQDKVDQLDQKSLLASKNSGLTREQKENALLGSVGPDGNVNNQGFRDGLDQQRNPQDLQKLDRVRVRSAHNVIERYRGRQGYIKSISGNAYTVVLDPTESEGSDTVVFIESELELISRADPASTPKRPSQSEMLATAIALLQRVRDEGVSGVCEDIGEFLRG
ncbi:MAG: hypothetical protein AAGD25_06770 [Cyanobacteria bacterium P01_F01_bin.150]